MIKINCLIYSININFIKKNVERNNIYNKDSYSFKKKFYLLIDLLITNQSSSRMECIIFLSIYYLQTLCGFFSEQIGVFNKNSTSILFFTNKVICY